MKFGGDSPELDAIDLQIINLLQEHGRIPLVKLGDQVGLPAPSVTARVNKLEAETWAAYRAVGNALQEKQ